MTAVRSVAFTLAVAVAGSALGAVLTGDAEPDEIAERARDLARRAGLPVRAEGVV